MELSPTPGSVSAPFPMDVTPHPWLRVALFLDPPPRSAAGAFVCLLEYPRSKRQKGSTMERW